MDRKVTKEAFGDRRADALFEERHTKCGFGIADCGVKIPSHSTAQGAGERDLRQKPFRKEFQSSKRSSNAPGVRILIP